MSTLTRDEFGDAYNRDLSSTIAFLRRRGTPKGAAQEIAQEAWVRAWERLPELRDPSMVGFWVQSIACNIHRRRVGEQGCHPDVPAPVTCINQNGIELQRLVRRCRARDRQVLEAVLEGFTVEEYAADQGISVSASRSRWFRARHALVRAAGVPERTGRSRLHQRQPPGRRRVGIPYQRVGSVRLYPGQHVRLYHSTNAVPVDEATIVPVPAGSIITLVSAHQDVQGFMLVRWQKRDMKIFAVDIAERGIQVKPDRQHVA